jgi:type III restriction enzyme
VNQLATYGRWAFAEFRDIYEIEANFKTKVESAFDEMIAAVNSSKQEVHA